MPKNSIKKTLPRMAILMIILLIFLILPANVIFQIYIRHESQKENSAEVLSQFEQLIAGNEGNIEQEKEEVRVTLEFSMGYAFYPMDGQDYHTLMHIADENMYQEKKRRKNSESYLR